LFYLCKRVHQHLLAISVEERLEAHAPQAFLAYAAWRCLFAIALFATYTDGRKVLESVIVSASGPPKRAEPASVFMAGNNDRKRQSFYVYLEQSKIISEAPEKSGCLLAEARAN
jgi:hypothetical protein